MLLLSVTRFRLQETNENLQFIICSNLLNGDTIQCGVFNLHFSLLLFFLFSCGWFLFFCLWHSSTLSHLLFKFKLGPQNSLCTPSSVYSQLTNLSSIKSFLMSHRRYKRFVWVRKKWDSLIFWFCFLIANKLD